MKQFTLLVTLIMFFSVKGQQLIDVTDQTIKVAGLKEEEILFGFAKGDKIVLNFEEINGKEIKEVEVIEYPDNSRFSDFKTSKIQNKTFNVNRQGVYMFRFKNANVAGRICKIQIQRVPASEETVQFNTNVKWVTKQDTTWNTYTREIITAYDTSYEQKIRKELVHEEQREEIIMDKSQRVHSQTNSNGNKTTLFFTLPPNEVSAYNSRKIIAWAYWVGVGEEATQAWKANVQAVGNLVKGAAAYFTTPLGALAVGTIAELVVPKVGEDVYYAVADELNKNLFLAGYQYKIYDQGKGTAGFKKFTSDGLCQGTYYICMSNDNYLQGIDVNVKVVAIVENKTYADRQYAEMVVKPVYERRIFTEPLIRTYEFPVTGD